MYITKRMVLLCCVFTIFLIAISWHIWNIIKLHSQLDSLSVCAFTPCVYLGFQIRICFILFYGPFCKTNCIVTLINLSFKYFTKLIILKLFLYLNLNYKLHSCINGCNKIIMIKFKFYEKEINV